MERMRSRISLTLPSSPANRSRSTGSSAGVTTELPRSLLDPGATLAVFVFHLLSTVPGGQKAAYTAAAVLFFVTFGIQVGIACANRRERFAW